MTDLKPRGFTLVEILVAMTIFSVTLLALFSTFRTVSFSSDRVKNEILFQDHIQQCLQIIMADIDQIHISHPPQYHPPEFNQAPDLYRFFGTETAIDGMVFSHLQFASLNHLDLGPGHIHGIGRIQYYVHPRENRFDLHRFDGTFLSDTEPDPCRDPVLLKDIHTFSLTFTDIDGTGHTVWDSDSARFDHTFPARITITVNPAGDDTSNPLQATLPVPVSRQVKK
jgi:prepilin-type N-terminal cleavage/methylation domain-containing protein